MIISDPSLSPSLKQPLTNRTLAIVTMHGRPVKLQIFWLFQNQKQKKKVSDMDKAAEQLNPLKMNKNTLVCSCCFRLLEKHFVPIFLVCWICVFLLICCYVLLAEK